MTMNDRITAESFPPGHFIKMALDRRGWSQGDLAEITGKTAAAISELINGRRALTPEMAVFLGEAFNTSADVWMNLESAYRLSQVKTPNGTSPVRQRAQLYAKVPPLKDMIKRNWIEASDDPEVLTDRILRFYERDNLEQDFTFQYAARKSGPYDEDRPELVAWLVRARQLARTLTVSKPWKSINMRPLINELKDLMARPEETRHVPGIAAHYGIRLVIVEPISRSKVDGACFWLSEEDPVVALSLRFDRIDNFWFTLLHEIAHVGRHDGSVDLDIQDPGSDKAPQEKAADEFAANTLVPRDQLLDFKNRNSPLYTRRLVRAFAARLTVHPGIVVGQIHRLEGDYRYFREMLVGVRENIVPSTLTDGWGSTVQLSL